MVSTTRCCARNDLSRWLLTLCLAWCGMAAAAGEGIHVKSAEISRSGGDYYIDANFEVGLTHTLEDALNKGLPLHFVVEFELIRPRWYTLYLWNKTVLEFDQRYRLSYNALTRQYRLSMGALHQNFDTLDEALALLGRLRSRFLANAELLDEGKVYEAAIRMRLDVSQLPRPFQFNALASRDWNLASAWFRWTIVR
ncbi:MAG TPA: DUF4390 domain-containing protein [Burkholderiales bacterium]|nr:DUF4390 domain-containing protein [Burkholderiales bacterium]